MELGMIGLGKMGAFMTERLVRGGHRVVGVDRDPAAVDRATRLAVHGKRRLVAEIQALGVEIPVDAAPLAVFQDCCPRRPANASGLPQHYVRRQTRPDGLPRLLRPRQDAEVQTVRFEGPSPPFIAIASADPATGCGLFQELNL